MSNSRKNYAISCGHELTARAAEDILRAGGNALDGAIAAFVMSWVVEPCMSGPGGAGYAICAYEGKAYSLDFFTQTPRFKRPVKEIDFREVEIDFGGTTEIYCCGLGSIAVPGAVDSIYKLHSLGARLPMRELVAPAIEIARDGHALDHFQHYDLSLLQGIFSMSQVGKALFMDNDMVKPVGATIYLPQMSDYLDHMSREGRDTFYKGEVGARILDACRTAGGHLTRADLENYETWVSRPLTLTLGKTDLYVNNTSSAGAQILSVLLSELSEKRFAGISPEQALFDVMRRVQERSREYMNIKTGGTSHLNVIDGEGNAVSLSMSLGEGSGYFVPGTDIQLNNMLGESALQPDGMHTWLPGTRLHSMMTPAVAASEAHQMITATGSGGSARIPYAIAQVLNNIYWHRMPTDEAVRAPRVYFDGRTWQVEPGIAKPKVIPREEWNPWPAQNLYFGGVHTSVMHKTDHSATGDERRNGCAVSR